MRADAAVRELEAAQRAAADLAEAVAHDIARKHEGPEAAAGACASCSPPPCPSSAAMSCAKAQKEAANG